MVRKQLNILIHASLDFKDKMIKARDKLSGNNFGVILPELTRYQHIRDEYGNDKEFTRIKTRLTDQNIKNVESSDCLLILNYNHRGIRNYIGGNSFLEMVIAYYLKKPIYLLKNIPEGMPYTEELKALSPIVVGSIDGLINILERG